MFPMKSFLEIEFDIETNIQHEQRSNVKRVKCKYHNKYEKSNTKMQMIYTMYIHNEKLESSIL